MKCWLGWPWPSNQIREACPSADKLQVALTGKPESVEDVSAIPRSSGDLVAWWRESACPTCGSVTLPLPACPGMTAVLISWQSMCTQVRSLAPAAV